MSELRADALEEEPREALPIDRRDARRRDPPDQPEPDHTEVGPQPVPLEAKKKSQYRTFRSDSDISHRLDQTT